MPSSGMTIASGTPRTAATLRAGVSPCVAAAADKPRDERRQHGFEQVETQEEQEQAEHQTNLRAHAKQEYRLRGEQHRHRPAQYKARGTLAVGIEQKRQHAEKAEQHGRQG